MGKLVQDERLLDQIREYIFTMNNEQLEEVRDFIESMLAGEGEEQ